MDAALLEEGGIGMYQHTYCPDPNELSVFQWSFSWPQELSRAIDSVNSFNCPDIGLGNGYTAITRQTRLLHIFNTAGLMLIISHVLSHLVSTQPFTSKDTKAQGNIQHAQHYTASKR